MIVSTPGSLQPLDLLSSRPGATAAVCAAVLAISSPLVTDAGTRVVPRVDLRSVTNGTHLTSYSVLGQVEPFVMLTRTQRLLALTGLSQRQLGEVLGVSHTMIGNWSRTEPARDEIGLMVSAVEDARRDHADGKTGLLSAVPGT